MSFKTVLDCTLETLKSSWKGCKIAYRWLMKINMTRILLAEIVLFTYASIYCMENYPQLISLPSTCLFTAVQWGMTYLLMRYGFKKIDTQQVLKDAIAKGHVFAQEVHFLTLYIIPGLIQFILILILTGG